MAPPTLIDVLFVLLPDSLILDWAGPAEALRIDERRHADAREPPEQLRARGADRPLFGGDGFRGGRPGVAHASNRIVRNACTAW